MFYLKCNSVQRNMFFILCFFRNDITSLSPCEFSFIVLKKSPACFAFIERLVCIPDIDNKTN